MLVKLINSLFQLDASASLLSYFIFLCDLQDNNTPAVVYQQHYADFEEKKVKYTDVYG